MTRVVYTQSLPDDTLRGQVQLVGNETSTPSKLAILFPTSHHMTHTHLASPSHDTWIKRALLLPPHSRER